MTEDLKRDEELQERLDEGKPVAVDADALAYRLLYRELARSDAALPTSFAYRTMAHVVAGRVSAARSAISLMSLALGAAALAAGLLAVYVLGRFGIASAADLSFGLRLIEVPVLIRYVCAVFVLVLVLDAVTDHRRQHRL